MSDSETNILTDKRLKVGSARILVFLLIAILILSLFYGALTTKLKIKRNIVLICLIAYFAFAVYRLDIFNFLMLFLFVVLVFPFSFLCQGIMGKTLRGIWLDNTLLFWPIMFFLFIGEGALHGKLKIYKTPSDKWILLYLIVFTLSVFYAFFVVENHWINVLRDGFRFSRIIFLIYIIICVLDRKDKLARFNTFMFLLGACFGIYGIIEYFLFPNESLQGGSIFMRTRIKTLFGHPNSYAGYLENTLPFVFAFAVFMKGNIKKFLFWGLFIILYINMILTFSRASFLTVNFSLLIMSLIRFGKKALLFWVAIIGIFVLLGTTTPILQRQFMLFEGGSGLNEKSDIVQQSNLFRIYEYTHLIKDIKDKPLFGAGLGSKTMGMYVTLQNLGQYVRSYMPIKNMYAHHSFVLDSAGRMGIFASFLLIMVFITIFTSLYKAYRFTSDNYLKANVFGTIGSIIAFSPHQIVDNFIDSNVLIYFIFVVSVGIVAWRYIYNVEE